MAVFSVNRWWLLASSYALLVVVVLGYFLLGMPVQLTDSYGNIVKASEGTFWSLVVGEFFQHSYLRPFLWALLRVLLDLSGGHYSEWFRGFHIAQVAVLVALFLRLVRPVTRTAAAAVPLGLAVLLGAHTFTGTVAEAFPINTFLTILICTFAAADLALGTPRWWRDAAAAALCVFAALTVESGLLVPVVFAAAYVAGARGVSRAGLGAQAALVCGYFALRFALLGVGAPGLEERSSGFGFTVRDPAELTALFGAHPLVFYAYNVAGNVLSVLLAEPRGGVWRFTGDLVAGRLSAGAAVNVSASVLATGLLVWFGWQRRTLWRSRRFERADQLVIVFAGVLLANAAIGYAYSKDVILSPAGAFLGVAVTMATQHLLESLPRVSWRRAMAGVTLVTVLSCSWAVRAVGLHVTIRKASANARTDWAFADAWLDAQRLTPRTPFEIGLKAQLQNEAVRARRSDEPLRPDWMDWFESH